MNIDQLVKVMGSMFLAGVSKEEFDRAIVLMILFVEAWKELDFQTLEAKEEFDRVNEFSSRLIDAWKEINFQILTAKRR